MRASGLLGHQGDGGGACPDRQAWLDGILGGAQVVQRVPVADGQVRYDLVVLALKRRKVRERAENALGQLTKRARVARGEPEHFVAKPVRMVKLEAESADFRE